MLLCAVTARSASESIRIDYSAAPGCPSEREFVTQVLERTDSAELSSESEGARTFVVVIRGARGNVRGSLVIRETDGGSVARTFEGEHCAEVAMALALATALAIDPGASFSPRHDAEPPVSNATPDAPHELPEREPLSRPDGGGSVDAWQVFFGPWVATGIAPRPALGANLGVHRAIGNLRGSFGASARAVFAPRNSVSGASSSFQAFVAVPQLCVPTLRFGTAFVMAPCLGVELGAIRAFGFSLPVSGSDARLWSSVEVGLRPHLKLSGRWFLGGEANLVMPLTRYRYHFDNPDTTVHDVPRVAAALGVHLGLDL